LQIKKSIPFIEGIDPDFGTIMEILSLRSETLGVLSALINKNLL